MPDRPELSMDAVLSAAVADNVRWCATVCRTHGIGTTVEHGVWTTAARPPRFYPDAITLDPAVTAEQVVAALGDRSPASVKDSFAAVDLDRHGYQRLFSASWIRLDPSPGTEGKGIGDGTWRIVDDPRRLDAWTVAHGSADVFGPALLAQPGVLVLERVLDGGVMGGAITTVGTAVVGISNVFATAADDVWPSLVAQLRVRFPGRTFVGYERDDDLAAARAAGFRELGPLGVWVRD